MHSLSLRAAPIASLQTAISPRLQRAVRLLQMSSQDFAQVVRDALDTNPFLEQEEAQAGTENEAATDDPAPPPSPAEIWGVEGSGRVRHADGDAAAFDTLEARTSLATHLLGQLHVLPLSPRDQALAGAVVESLDDDGYLGECSPTAIRGLIQEMIEAEAPAQPLSDVEIARQLSRQGLQVARRTVTKYRQLLKIAAAERRRGRGMVAAGLVQGGAHGF